MVIFKGENWPYFRYWIWHFHLFLLLPTTGINFFLHFNTCIRHYIKADHCEMLRSSCAWGLHNGLFTTKITITLNMMEKVACRHDLFRPKIGNFDHFCLFTSTHMCQEMPFEQKLKKNFSTFTIPTNHCAVAGLGSSSP